MLVNKRERPRVAHRTAFPSFPNVVYLTARGQRYFQISVFYRLIEPRSAKDGEAIMLVLSHSDLGCAVASETRRRTVNIRPAHQAVVAAKAVIALGHRILVDIDLEKFFDRSTMTS